MDDNDACFEWRCKGNEAFVNGEYNKAVEWYSKAIDSMPQQGESLPWLLLLWSHRSAAYLKSGQLELALKDAEQCLELDPDSKLGRARLQEVQEEMKKKDNNQQDPEQQVTSLSSMDKGRATMIASVSKHQRAASSDTMSQFVCHTKHALELELHAIQAKLDLVHSLENMTDAEKVAMLFDLVDKDHDNRVDARELARILRTKNANLALGESIERAVSFVATFDKDHDAMLSFNEFKTFIYDFTASLGKDIGSLKEVAEFLIYQHLYGDKKKKKKHHNNNNNMESPIDEEEMLVPSNDELKEAVRDQAMFINAITDPRMAGLFSLFDKDGSGNCDFEEVAIGLFKLTHNMKDAAKMAVNVLLMMDHGDNESEEERRTMDYEQFSRLIVSVVTMAGTTFQEAADDLTYAMVQTTYVSPQDIRVLMMEQEHYEAAAKAAHDAEVMNTLQYARLVKLFRLWTRDDQVAEVNGDGEEEEEGDGGADLPLLLLDARDLMSGLEKFKKSFRIDEELHDNVMAEIGLVDDPGSLDQKGFANVMTSYAQSVEADLHELINFLCVVIVMEEDSPMENAFYKAISQSHAAPCAPQFNNLTSNAA